MRRSNTSDADLAAIVRAQQVPREIFIGTFRLLGDSIIRYYGKESRNGPFRYYPAILMSAWASFESFVRIYSELLVKTSRGLPSAVEEALLEKESVIDDQGRLKTKNIQRSLLDRYWWLLKFGYGYECNRGSRIWQMGKAAIDKRNELVHYKFSDMPSLKTTELWQQLEAILLMLIGPSAYIRKSVMPDQYELYGILCALRPLIEDFEEKPFFKGSQFELEAVIFPCPFENVDDVKFPGFS
jgi:hypothetical protein